MECHSDIPQVLDPQHRRKYVFGVLVQHEDLPHGRARRCRHLQCGCALCASWCSWVRCIYGIVEIQQGEQSGCLRLLEGGG